MITSPRPPYDSASARSPPPDRAPLSPTPELNDDQTATRRRGSFSFLRRTKSGTQLSAARTVSGGKLTKKQRVPSKEQETYQEQIARQPPKIPDIPRTTQLQTFGGENAKPDKTSGMLNRVGAVYQHDSVPPNMLNRIGSNMYGIVPIPPIPGDAHEGNGGFVDPYARTESMTHRGRYSYASSAISTISSPRRMRRRKDPTPFNILIIGARNSGKTSFLNFLRRSLALPAQKQRPQLHDDIFNLRDGRSARAFPHFSSHYVETEAEGEKIGLTLWDSPGLEAHLVDLQLREMSSFLESKFENTFNEELKVVRATGVRDTHIHCVFLVLDPSRLDSNIAKTNKISEMTGGIMNGNSFVGPRSTSLAGGLDEDFDLTVLRALQGKTTVVPIIAKADTITSAHMSHLKRVVWNSLKRANLDTLEALRQDDGDAESFSEINAPPQRYGSSMAANHSRTRSEISQLDSPTDSNSSFSASDFDLAKPTKPWASNTPSASSNATPPLTAETPLLPLSIISPDMYEPEVAGRKFPWGFADPYNETHCDFLRLKDMVFTELREDFRESSRELYYENWRTSRLDRAAPRSGEVGLAR